MIEKLMQDYNCTEEEATKAFLDAQDTAQNTFNQKLHQTLGGKVPESVKQYDVTIFTPRQIKEYLDKYVIGQEEYKKRLSIAAAYHFAMVKHLGECPEEKKVRRFRKKNTITTGPSGSGKTYCVEVLGDLLQVPTLLVDATDYTEAGYVGKNADDMIRELIDLAPGSSRKEQAQFISRYGGLIFIDEIDKKAKEGQLVGHDISREGFQRAVLKLIERKQVSIENPYSPAFQMQEMLNKQKNKPDAMAENMITTENILFVLGGSFERTVNSLDEIVEKRLVRGTRSDDESPVIRGFTTENNIENKNKVKNFYKKAEADDFIKFGLLPELVGRSPIRTFVNPLSKNNLIRIMNDTEDSILNQYELEFQLFGIKLSFGNNAIEYVAELAENIRTGARALVSVWENILTDFQFELPGMHFKELKVDRKLCEMPKDVLLSMMEKSPFLDFIETFKREYGIELIFDEEAMEYMKAYAEEHHLQLSETLKKLLFGATALSYMHVKGAFQITVAMLQEEKYFDKIFTEWYQERTVTLPKSNTTP